jgi:hypothetical protein
LKEAWLKVMKKQETAMISPSRLPTTHPTPVVAPPPSTNSFQEDDDALDLLGNLSSMDEDDEET